MALVRLRGDSNMAVTPTYPGVYVQEVPSGVRTIVGVGTSTALIVGRTRQGPLTKPIRCLNFADFERAFSSAYAESDLARAVRLFFLNGGTDAYVVRIADGAQPARVTLKSEAQANVLKVTARSAGLVGNDIRLAVSYDTDRPEATFNLEVFRLVKNSAGGFDKADAELFRSLSMQPNTPRYARDFVNQRSSLVELEDVST